MFLLCAKYYTLAPGQEGRQGPWLHEVCGWVKVNFPLSGGLSKVFITYPSALPVSYAFQI